MANDIFGSELNVDFSGILHQADEFDKKLKDIDHTAKQLGTTLRNALGNLDFGGLKSLKDNIERLGESKISLKVVGAEELTKMSSIIDTLISQVEVFSKGGVSVFDSKALYSDNNNVLELSASLEKVDQKISKLKEAWKSIGTSKQLAASDELFKGFVSPTHKNGTEYKPESKTYQNAMREHLEAQARIAIEEKAILSESLNWAKMTEDEKAAYIQKKLNDIFKAEEQQAKRVRKEYSDTVNEMVSLMKQTDSLNKKNTDGSITPQVKQMEDRFTELNAKRVQLEQQYGEHVVDIAQKTNSKVLAIEANRILEKNKKEKEETEKWYSTATGARYKANTAHTIGEKEEAMGYLKTAMKNTYSPELMDELRNKYQELRIAVEEHKKALNGELSLQPTVRAEYMRLRKELDSVVESKEKLAKTQAYKSGDEVAKSDYNAMAAREEDIQAKIIQIRKNAQGQLDAVDREYESKRAQASVDVFTKAENQKTEIAKQRLRAQLAESSKYGNISADSALRMVRVTDNASNVSQHEAAIRKLKDAINHLDESSFDYGATLDKLNQKIKAHEDAIRRASMTEAEYYKQIEANYQKEKGEYWKNQAKTSPNAILTYSKEADSINNQIKAIELLKIARDNLNKTAMGDTAYLAKVKELNEEIKRQQTEVDKLRGKQEQLKNSKKGLMDTMGQLQRKLALLFSVSAIQGYIQKMAQVRAEFELNQRSLQAILQNKEKADELWGQTIQLALKSPFRVKELVGYTKQLAAYRIESDKLFETNKRLADVSAGLGVDMQRLILAYGQVRAAEYLRGTELRQFTEAGIPMLDELARYFTELEGHAVSTADVFQRISKRMVNFADVEEVFRRLTNAGGVFYEMQEKQAETLKGQISNLHDALDLMLNDIGTANDGTMKSLVGVARDLIDNWEEVWLRLKVVLATLAAFGAKSLWIKFLATETGRASVAAYKSTMAFTSLKDILIVMQIRAEEVGIRLRNLWASIKSGTSSIALNRKSLRAFISLLGGSLLKAVNVARAGFAALKVAMSSFLPFLVITALSELYFWLTESSREAGRLKEAMSGVDSELGKDLEKSISAYERLARTISDGTKSYTEREEAMQEMKRTFEDVLPSIYTEKEAIIAMAGDYEKATEALRLYYGEKARQQKIDKLNEHYQDKFATDIKESANVDVLNVGVGGIQEDEYVKVLSNVVEKAKEQAQLGVLWDKDQLKQELADALSEYYGFSKEVKETLTRNLDIGSVGHNLGDIVDELRNYKKDFNTIGGLPANTKVEETKIKNMAAMRKEYEEYKKTQAEINGLLNKYNNLQKKSKQTEVSVDKKEFEAVEKELKDKYKEAGITIPVGGDFSKVTENAIVLQKEMDRVGTSINTNFVNHMGGVGTAITNAANGIYTMDNALAGMSQKPIPPAISGIATKSPEMKSMVDALTNTNFQLQTLDGTPVPTVFSYFPKAIAGAEDLSGAYIKMAEDVVRESDKLVDKPYQNFINNIVQTVAQEKGLTLDMLDFLVVGAEATAESVKQSWKSQYDDLLARHASAKQILAEQPLLSMHYVMQITGLQEYNSLDDAKKAADAILSAAKKAGFTDFLGNNKGGSKKGGKKQENPAKDFAKVLEDMYKSYQEFNEKLGEDDSFDRVIKNRAKAFNEAKKKMGNFGFELKDFDFTSIEGLTVALEKLKKTPQGAKIATDIENTLAKLTDDRDLKIEKEREDARDREIDQLFEMYELYKELEKNNIPTDWAKSFFNIDATSLADLRSKLEQMKAEGEFTGTDDEETYQKYLDKISEMEQKEQEERLKTYLQYARDAVGERAKIKLEELKKLSEIEQAFKPLETDTPEVKEQKEQAKEIATQKVKDESAQATKKLEWEEFQKSDMFLMIFEDLESASGTLMESTLKKIEDFKEQWADMPLEEVRAMTEKINQLESALLKLKNPFRAVGEINKSIEEILGGQTREQVNQEAWESQQKIDQNNIEIGQLETIRDMLLEGKDISKEQRDTYTQMTGSTQENVETLNEEIKNRKDDNKELNKSVTRARQLTKAEKDKINAYNAQADAYNNINKMANDLYDASKELVELFVDDDSIGMVFADMGMSIADSVLSTLSLQANLAATKVQLEAAGLSADSFAMKMNAAMGVVGWIVMGIQLITQVLSAAFKAYDKGKQKEIDEEVKSIERLEKELENLEERLETVYSLGGVNKSMRQVQANIDKQIQSYEKMMRLEEEKKSTDKEQIEEWEENIEELREKRKELHKEMVESLGGNYDVRSVAREFVDAWIDAFKETGDGLKGLRDNFKDFFLNILLEQAVMQKVGSFFSDAMDYLNNTVLSDYIVTDAERKQTEGMFDEAMIKTDDYLNLLFGENGVLNKYIDDTDSSLSGLQQGIQGVTEETAQIIEAYLNSIRFYIAQDNQNLAKLVDTFTNVESPNPILNELRTQTELITSIRDLFRDVVRMGHPTYGGAFLKVAL